MSFCFCLCVWLLDWCVTEAEEHRRSAGFLDGQRLRAAQLHQAGPRPEPRHAGRPGHPRPLGPDGLQVSLCVDVNAGRGGRLNITALKGLKSLICKEKVK